MVEALLLSTMRMTSPHVEGNAVGLSKDARAATASCESRAPSAYGENDYAPIAKAHVNRSPASSQTHANGRSPLSASARRNLARPKAIRRNQRLPIPVRKPAQRTEIRARCGRPSSCRVGLFLLLREEGEDVLPVHVAEAHYLVNDFLVR